MTTKKIHSRHPGADKTDPDAAAMRERFLGVFQGDVRNNILAFSQCLWNRDSDYFLFMARKAACFFDCLRELGIADVRGLALSDRVLDMDISYLKGKSVTLVDDSIFTGTTLFNARNAVLEAGATSFETLTLAVNSDYIRRDLLPGGAEAGDLAIAEPIFVCSDSDCVRQCYDIVRSISVVPRPYDVDFPHTKTAKVKATAFDDLLSLPGWTALEATSDFQRANGVRVFTMLPSTSELGLFCAKHNAKSVDIEAAKIRLYARQVSGSSYSLRLVPIVMLPPLHDSDVQASVAKCWDADSLLSSGIVSQRARYRFLHYVVAHCLLDFFSEKATRIRKTRLPVELRMDLFEMTFGTRMAALYTDRGTKRDCLSLPRRHAEPIVTIAPGLDLHPRTEDAAAGVVAEAMAPFTWLYKERELETREHVRVHGLRRDPDAEGGVHMNRLREGFTPGFLLSRVQSSCVAMRSFLSLLLDRFVDMGIAVPTTVQVGDVCSRAFRHGEDAILGEAQERMIIEALGAYLEEKGEDGVWGLELQKFVVLFIQIAIRNGLLDHLSVLPSVPLGSRIVSVKGHLHGPVPVVEELVDPSGSMGPPHIAGNEDTPRWLVDDWVRKRYMRSSHSKRGTRYVIHERPKLSIGARTEAQARQIGRCLGSALAIKAINNDNDLVMLSTCGEADHQVRAISGEISIFRERWPALVTALRSAARKSSFTEAHTLLRSRDSVFTAVNSGARKYRWYLEKNFERTSDKVGTALKAAGKSAMSDEWLLLWPHAQPLDKDNEAFVWRHINDCGRWLYTLNVGMRLFDYWFCLRSLDQGQIDEKKVTDLIRDVKLWASRLLSAFSGHKKPPFVQLMGQVLKQVEERNSEKAFQWCESAGNVLTTFAKKNSRLLLDEATIICNTYGKSGEPEAFPYGVFFDVGDENRLVLRRCMEDAASSRGTRFRLLPEIHNPWRCGEWLLLPGNRRATTAVEICKEVSEELSNKAITFRAAVIGQLSADECIRAFSNSVELAHGFFFRRLGQLKDAVLARDLTGSIGFASETGEGFETEGEKFARLLGVSGAESREVTFSDDDVPDKTFSVEMTTPRPIKMEKTMNESITEAPATPSITVLLCTATDKEDDILVEAVDAAGLTRTAETRNKGTYTHIGIVGNCDVYWVRSGMGSSGSSGSALTINEAIDELRPRYVVSCGLGFGRSEDDQKLGDVLVSEWVRAYEKGRAGAERFIPRGARTDADPRLLQACRAVRIDRRDDLRVTTGGLLSGEKLVDDPEFKREILRIEPEALGGEMEGAGIVDACERAHVGWIVVKAICDWAENKDGAAQPAAAKNAISFVLSVLNSKRLAPAM